jgi:hypothetical protein
VNCPYTSSVWPQWQQIRHETLDDETIFAETSGALTDQFFLDHKMPLPVNAVRISAEMRSKNRLIAVPATVLLGEGGKVEKAWVGPLKQAELIEIISGLKSSLTQN